MNNVMIKERNFHYLDPMEGNTMFELTELSQQYIDEPTTKLPNGNLPTNHRDHHYGLKLPSEPRSRIRRKFFSILLIILLIAATFCLAIPFGLQLRSSSLLEARLQFVRRILHEAPLIQGAGGNASEYAAARLTTITVPCGAQYLDAVQLILEELDVVQRSGETILHATNELTPGYPAVFLGVLGGHTLGDSLGVLRSLYSLGVRFIAPMYGCNTAWANGGIAPSLSEFGEYVIREINRLGFVIDLTGMYFLL